MRYVWFVLFVALAPYGVTMPNFMRESTMVKEVVVAPSVKKQVPIKANTLPTAAYLLGAGDLVRLTVYGEEDLSGEYEIDGSGRVALPLIGGMAVGGLTVRQLEQNLEDKFSDGYLNNPKVSVEILNFRPFYIVGEVNNPGSYAYVNGLTVLSAVAVAGGYTHRAKKRNMKLIRQHKSGVHVLKAEEATLIKPGDTIEIKERFF